VPSGPARRRHLEQLEELDEGVVMTITAPIISRPKLLPVARAGAVAALIGAVVLYGYGALADALSVPMRVAGVGEAHAEAIGPFNFVLGTVICTFWGTVLALALERWASRPARAFVRSAVVLVAVSLLFPLLANDTATSTRLVLAGGHLIAAAVVVPIITAAVAAGRK
jgi:hypothetical protein